MANRYPGICACGTYVQSGEGVAIRDGAKWTVQCEFCRRQASAPEREMLGVIYWPNGMGQTLCSLEYEEAISAVERMREARADFEFNMDKDKPEDRAEFNRLDHVVYTAENIVNNMLADGGHLGERITFDEPDAMTALLGGGKVNIAPGGVVSVAKS
jgi:hypothetical protein